MKKTNRLNSSERGTGKKSRVGFNFIDVLLILFVLAIVFVAINVISPMSIFSRFNSEDAITIRYTVEFLGVDGDYIDKIAENDVVIDSVSKHTLGTVSVVDNNTQHTSLEYNEVDGTPILAVHEGKYDVVVTITASGIYREGEGYRVNDRRIAVGEKLSLRFPNYAAEGYCIALTVDEGVGA